MRTRSHAYDPIPVIVATPEPDCPAAQALATEGIAYELRVCDDEFAYGRSIADTWSRGTGFILVEWDVAPWPGAIQALKDCAHDYCFHEYPKFGALGGTLGCVKFSRKLTRTRASLAKRWRRVPWAWVDNAVCIPIMARTEAHCHQPPVAHVRRSC